MRLYIDENMSPRVAKILREVEDYWKNEVYYIPNLDGFGKGSKDEDIFLELSKEDAIFVTQDSDFKKMIKGVAKDLQIGVVHFKFKNIGGFEEILKMILKHWMDTRKLIINSKRPFYISITPTQGPKSLPL